MASSALSATLKSITATKIDEVSKQQQAFDDARTAIAESANQYQDILDKVDATVTGYCGLEGVYLSDDSSSDAHIDASTAIGQDLQNKTRFLHQAKVDPSFSQDILRLFSDELNRTLDLQNTKNDHTLFFSNLATEWLNNLDRPAVNLNANTESDDMSLNDSATFQPVGRKEMHEQRADWERFVFEDSLGPEPVAIKAYLDKLFKSDKSTTTAVESLCSTIRSFSSHLEYSPDLFTVENLNTAISGVRGTDLLSDEKNEILKEFSRNKEVAREVVDVLNMKLGMIKNWNWTHENGVPLEMRRQLNGKYRVFMDEDVLDALLLHYIGMQWAVTFKDVFNTFVRSSAWGRSTKTMPAMDKERREFFLGADATSASTVQAKRRLQYQEDYFMTQLPSDVEEGVRAYDEGDSDDGEKASGKNPLDIKHSLLHLLITEALLARRLHGEQTIIRSDLKWFGPSLPHSTIFTILEYFGVTKTWITFFHTFLTAPMRFTQDGPDAQVQSRNRGVPMSHALSDVFGEVVLFCMDYAVNRHTDGQYLYRLHDDFWFWGSKSSCQKAWRAMTEIADFMGLTFNEEKTGSVSLGRSKDFSKATVSSDDDASNDKLDGLQVDNDLPKGDIRWGFLKLGAEPARFVIDQAEVDKHIVELKRQLSACKSIFSWVQAYNSYLARFFTNNFGKPAYCFGRAHIDMMIDTHVRIQKVLFSGSSVTEHLRSMIRDRFNVNHLPEGFFYFPVELGGLGLKNPLPSLFCMRESLRQTPEKMLEKALDQDYFTHLTAKSTYEKHAATDRGMSRNPNPRLTAQIKESGENFMSLEEYTKYREERSRNLHNVYMDLLAVPAEKAVHATPEVKSALTQLKIEVTGRTGGIYAWRDMDAYWKWITSLYCKEMVEKYGGLAMVDQKKIPLGVVNMLRFGKLRWQG